MKCSRLVRCKVVMTQMVQWVRSANRQLSCTGLGLALSVIPPSRSRKTLTIPSLLILRSIEHHWHSSQGTHFRIFWFLLVALNYLGTLLNCFYTVWDLSSFECCLFCFTSIKNIKEPLNTWLADWYARGIFRRKLILITLCALRIKQFNSIHMSYELSDILKKHVIAIKRVSLLRSNFNTSTDNDKYVKSFGEF